MRLLKTQYRGNIEVILCYWKVMRLLKQQYRGNIICYWKGNEIIKTQYRGNIVLLEDNEIIKNTI